MDIHLVSTGEKSNPKPNPIDFGAANPKIMREKSFPNPNPKSEDMQLESEPLSSLKGMLGQKARQPIGPGTR